MEQEWSEASSSPKGPLPQQELTWLLNQEDFDEHVAKDDVNLCCVMVTSTLCRHCGIRKITYPKLKASKEAGPASSNEDEDDRGTELADEEGDDEENGEDDGGDGSGSAGRSHFFREVKQKLIESQQNLSQRRHVRFFHVCACTEEETNIEPLIAKDPTLRAFGRKPTEFEVKELHRTAYKQLVDLIQSLHVTSTPCLLFFLKGQPLRYSMMLDPAPANRVDVKGAKDGIVAVGSNYVKWRRVLCNATVVRNEVMKEHDEAAREMARQERREQRRKERAERRLARAREREEDEGDEEEEAED